MKTVTLARRAMHTRFELLLHGDSEPALRAAGEQALDEIERLEAQLSLFRPTSEIARINRHAAERPVQVSPPVFRLLQLAQQCVRATDGAFDPSVGPLMRAWGFRGSAGTATVPPNLPSLREGVGMAGVTLDEDHFTVRFERAGMELDLGAIGKGYAVDCAIELLREAGVTSGFLHGGTSSVCGLGVMPDGRPWIAAIPQPLGADAGEPPDPVAPGEAQHAGEILARIELEDRSLGVSAVWGRVLRSGTRSLGHVLDPRTGEPVDGIWLAAVTLPSAAESDALSTALLVLGRAGLESLRRFRPDLRGLVVEAAPGSGCWRIVSHELPCALQSSDPNPPASESRP
jgi:thiamine biosynthesis lipoprotein